MYLYHIVNFFQILAADLFTQLLNVNNTIKGFLTLIYNIQRRPNTLF